MKKLNWTNLVLGVSARCCHYTYAVGKGSEAELVRGVTSVCVCVPNSMFIDTAVVVASDVGRRTSTCSRTISTVKSLKWLSMFTCFWGVASHRMAMKWIFIAKAFFFSSRLEYHSMEVTAVLYELAFYSPRTNTCIG